MKDGNLTVLQDTEEQHNSYTLGPLKDDFLLLLFSLMRFVEMTRESVFLFSPK